MVTKSRLPVYTFIAVLLAIILMGAMATLPLVLSEIQTAQIDGTAHQKQIPFLW